MLPDEGNVDAHRSMLAGALVTKKNADVGAAPLWIFALAVETKLNRTL